MQVGSNAAGHIRKFMRLNIITKLFKMNYSYTTNLSFAKFVLFTPAQGFSTYSGNDSYSIIWNKGNECLIMVDGVPTLIKQNTIITLTPSHHFLVEGTNSSLFIMRFNESFYCVEKHDKEISCIGYIFYGTANITTILLDKNENEKFEILFEMIIEEFQTRDNIQGEMLTVLLKRLIIKCTRLARKQQYGKATETVTHSVIRQFNILVEINFKDEHTVSFYAKSLNISAKSLTNIFSMAKLPNPLTIIHNRILTEARRQILFSNKTIKEIAYELNFPDIQTFSRFFKSKQGVSPLNFKMAK